MFLIKLSVFLFILPLTHALIQIPFKGVYNDFGSIRFNLSIGNPPQKMEVELEFQYGQPDLYVPNAENFTVGFNMSGSSTYVKSNEINRMEWHSINGTDTFDLNGSIVKAKPFQVLSDYYTIKMKRGFMDVHRHLISGTDCPKENKGDCTTFVQSVLRDFDDQVLVLALDKITPTKKAEFTGNLIFGDKAPKLCQSNGWTFMPEVQNTKFNYEQWTFNLDKIQVGKYTFASTLQCTPILVNAFFALPKNVIPSILKALGSIDSKHVPCETKEELVFVLGGKELRVAPEYYIKKKKDGTCVLHNEEREIPCQLPLFFFSENCFLFDYKNLQLGFSKRVSN